MTRNFKLVKPDIGGTYTGHTPKQAAQKAFTQLRQQNKVRGETTFSIKETTIDSSRKVYNYTGHRHKLSEPQIVQFGSGKNAKDVTYTHKDEIYRVF
jgi:hypothetical protein